jgi:hypothetical protein
MHEVIQGLSRTVEQLLGRAGGPLHFRFLMMPTVITVLAIRAGVRDARVGRRQFLWLRDPGERAALLRSALKDIGRILIMALVLDTTYQIIVFRMFYPGQAIIVALVSAVVPYALGRCLTALVAQLLRKRARGVSIASPR